MWFESHVSNYIYVAFVDFTKFSIRLGDVVLQTTETRYMRTYLSYDKKYLLSYKL